MINHEQYNVIAETLRKASSESNNELHTGSVGLFALSWISMQNNMQEIKDYTRLSERQLLFIQHSLADTAHLRFLTKETNSAVPLNQPVLIDQEEEKDWNRRLNIVGIYAIGVLGMHDIAKVQHSDIGEVHRDLTSAVYGLWKFSSPNVQSSHQLTGLMPPDYDPLWQYVGKHNRGWDAIGDLLSGNTLLEVIDRYNLSPKQIDEVQRTCRRYGRSDLVRFRPNEITDASKNRKLAQQLKNTSDQSIVRNILEIVDRSFYIQTVNESGNDIIFPLTSLHPPHHYSTLRSAHILQNAHIPLARLSYKTTSHATEKQGHYYFTSSNLRSECASVLNNFNEPFIPFSRKRSQKLLQEWDLMNTISQGDVSTGLQALKVFADQGSVSRDNIGMFIDTIFTTFARRSLTTEAYREVYDDPDYRIAFEDGCTGQELDMYIKKQKTVFTNDIQSFFNTYSPQHAYLINKTISGLLVTDNRFDRQETRMQSFKTILDKYKIPSDIQTLALLNALLEKGLDRLQTVGVSTLQNTGLTVDPTEYWTGKMISQKNGSPGTAYLIGWCTAASTTIDHLGRMIYGYDSDKALQVWSGISQMNLQTIITSYHPNDIQRPIMKHMKNPKKLLEAYTALQKALQQLPRAFPPRIHQHPA